MICVLMYMSLLKDHYLTLTEEPCSQALFSNYVFSVVRELELSTENQLWIQAKCDGIHIVYDFIIEIIFQHVYNLIMIGTERM
jgi:hypothetical protein